ncbi:MAG: sigma-70 family RNA polymerase sigma factor [Phycisphaerae bacterium]
MMDEIEVINRILHGQVDAFRCLVLRYEKPVMCLVANLVGDIHTGEDIAQEVFFAAYRKLGSYDPERSRFSTWLFTIARNLSLNAMKKRIPNVMDDLPETIYTTTPDDEVARKEFFQQLDKKLDTLPPCQKAVFVMAEFVGLSYEEISQIEDIDIGTVRSRISRAKAALRSLFNQEIQNDR